MDRRFAYGWRRDFYFRHGRIEEGRKDAEAVVMDLEQQWQKAQHAAGSDSNLCNNLAWELATSPAIELRNPARAVALAREATSLTPLNGSYWRTLGAALYRAGDYEEAIEALDQAIEVGGANAHNWLLLAMAHCGQGHQDQACTWYDKAMGWLRHNIAGGELLRFKAEAEELLMISPLNRGPLSPAANRQ